MINEKIERISSWLKDQYHDDDERDDMSIDDWIIDELKFLVEKRENYNLVMDGV